MRDFLSKMIGKRVDIYCGGSSSLRGDVVRVEDGVVQLRDNESKTCYVAMDKIIVVWEAPDGEGHRAGFVNKGQ